MLDHQQLNVKYLQKFTKTDLAKFYQCWNKKPSYVSKGTKYNFTQFMELMSDNFKNSNIDESFYKGTIARAIIYKTAESIARKHKFPGYRANAVAYTIALLSFKTVGRVNLEVIWNEQSVSGAFYSVLDSWMPLVWQSIIDTAGNRNVTEWAKKEECWSEIQLLDLTISTDLELELRTGDPLPNVGHSAKNGKAKELTTVDRQNINRVLQRSADFWWKLSVWGRETKELEKIHIDIISTLATYARDSWEKIPSHKQARQAIRALDIAEEIGYEMEC